MSGVLLLDGVGRVHAATPAADRLLRGAAADAVARALRALSGGCTLAGRDRPVVSTVSTVSTADGDCVQLTGEWAGGQLTVVVDRSRSSLSASLAPFTARERDVLRLADRGLPVKQMAIELGISPWTVQDHLQSMYAKAGVRSRSELVAVVRGV
jgi:DNA-binding CsgD family transcriptional regulator